MKCNSSQALSEGIIAVVGNAYGPTYAMLGILDGRWNDSSIELRR